MIVDLNPMPYRQAMELVRWCYEHDIDKVQCTRIITACTQSPVPDLEWTLDVPDKYLTYFAMKWA